MVINIKSRIEKKKAKLKLLPIMLKGSCNVIIKLGDLKLYTQDCYIIERYVYLEQIVFIVILFITRICSI